jgi:hypothetical protein
VGVSRPGWRWIEWGSRCSPPCHCEFWKDKYEREEFCMDSDVNTAFKELDKALDALDKKLTTVNIGIKKEFQDLGADVIKLMDLVKKK